MALRKATGRAVSNEIGLVGSIIVNGSLRGRPDGSITVEDGDGFRVDPMIEQLVLSELNATGESLEPHQSVSIDVYKR